MYSAGDGSTRWTHDPQEQQQDVRDWTVLQREGGTQAGWAQQGQVVDDPFHDARRPGQSSHPREAGTSPTNPDLKPETSHPFGLSTLSVEQDVHRSAFGHPPPYVGLDRGYAPFASGSSLGAHAGLASASHGPPVPDFASHDVTLQTVSQAPYEVIQSYAAFPAQPPPLSYPLPPAVVPDFTYSSVNAASSLADYAPQQQTQVNSLYPPPPIPPQQQPIWVDAQGKGSQHSAPVHEYRQHQDEADRQLVAGLGQLRSASHDDGILYERAMPSANRTDESAASMHWQATTPNISLTSHLGAQLQTGPPPPLMDRMDLWARPQPYALQPFSASDPSSAAPTTSLCLPTYPYETAPSSAPIGASSSKPPFFRLATYPPAAHSPSFASYPQAAASAADIVASLATAGPSGAPKRSRTTADPGPSIPRPVSSRRASKVSQASQNPNKKLTVDLLASCGRCGKAIARLILRGKRAELDVPHSAVFTCLDCSTASSTVSPEVESPAQKPKKPPFRKRNKRFDDASALAACDVCLRDIAVGGVLPVPSDPMSPPHRIDFMIDIVCAACDIRYKRCSDCGGGGGSRAGTGKWRCAELFPPQRKTCRLSHQRLGAFPAMEYAVWRNTEIPADEVDELSEALGLLFVNGMLAGLCIPEVLERDGAVYTTYEACYARATMGWKGFDPILRYDIERETGIRRYLALRTCTPNLRKPSRPTPDESPADSPEPVLPQEVTGKPTGIVMKEGKEIAGFIIAEHELLIGNLFLCIVLPWDPTGEIFDATSLLISALIRHVDADIKDTNAQRTSQGLALFPGIVKVWTMLFFKRDSRVLTSLVKKRGFMYLEDYLAAHPEVPRQEFPPHRPCYLPVERQQEGWEILVRQQRIMADGSVDDWGARRAADEERGKKKELRARAVAAAAQAAQ